MALGNGEVAVGIQTWGERKKENNGNVQSEQTSSNSIIGESSDKYLSVKDKAKFFESLQEGNAAAKELKRVEQQFNGQHLEQENAAYNWKQTPSNSITGEGSNNNGIYTKTNESTEEINAQNRNGCTSLREKRRERLVRRNNGLSLNGATCNDEQTSLNDSSVSNDSGIYIPTEEDIREELVESLKEHEKDINTYDENGWTRLHYAAAKNDEASVKLLIECGADVNAQDKNKRTPLHLAAVMSDIGIVKYLVENRADFNVQNKHGYTPLCYALAYRDYNDTEVVTYLVKECGASVPNQNTDIDKYKISRSKQSEVAPSHSKTNNVTEVQEKTRKLRAKLKKSRSQLKDKKDRNRSTDKINVESDKELKEVEQKLEEAQKDLETLKDHLAKNDTRLEAFNKLDEENKSLKQKIEDLESKNTTLNSELKESENKHSNYLVEHEAKLEVLKKQNQEESKLLEQEIKDLKSENTTLKDESEKNKNQHSQTSEVSLKKIEKKPPLSKIAYVSLVTTSMVGSILSVVSGLFVLSMIATSVTSALVAGGITYTMSKPTTELKEVNIQSPAQQQGL